MDHKEIVEILGRLILAGHMIKLDTAIYPPRDTGEGGDLRYRLIYKGDVVAEGDDPLDVVKRGSIIIFGRDDE